MEFRKPVHWLRALDLGKVSAFKKELPMRRLFHFVVEPCLLIAFFFLGSAIQASSDYNSESGDAAIPSCEAAQQDVCIRTLSDMP